MPATFTIGTPSGGEHHVFIGELPSTVGRPDRARKLGLHVDTRGGQGDEATGYGLLPPS
jgi:hypothetical protein